MAERRRTYYWMKNRWRFYTKRVTVITEITEGTETEYSFGFTPYNNEYDNFNKKNYLHNLKL